MFNEFLHKKQKNNKAGVDLGIIRFEKENMNKVVYASAKTNLFIYDSEDKSLVRHVCRHEFQTFDRYIFPVRKVKVVR